MLAVAAVPAVVVDLDVVEALVDVADLADAGDHVAVEVLAVAEALAVSGGPKKTKSFVLYVWIKRDC